jgi:hypothetical protein
VVAGVYLVAIVAAFSCRWFGSISTLLWFCISDTRLSWFTRKIYGFMFLDAFCVQIVWWPLTVVVVFVAVSCWLVDLLPCWRSGLFAIFQGFGFFGLIFVSITRDHSRTSLFLQFGFVFVCGYAEFCLECVFVC